MKNELCLLIIDDDADDRKLFVESAQEVDDSLVCVEATGGKEALEYLTDESNLIPDFIFLDLRMPKVSGQKCLDEIKKIPRLAQIPVFVYSTSTDKSDIKDLNKKGAVLFISKPTDPREIYYLISTVIGEKWV